MHAESKNSGPSVSPSIGALPHIFTTKIPLFHAAWLFACGITLAHFLWLRPTITLLALAPVAVFCWIAALRAQRVVWITLAALWFLLGAWCAEMEPHPGPAPAVSALSDGLLRTMEGTIISTGSVQNEAGNNEDETNSEGLLQRVDLRLSSIEFVNDTEDKQVPAGNGSVRLTVHWPVEATPTSSFHCGERLRVVARLFRPQIYRTPGAWNRADYLLDQGITSNASVELDHIEKIGDDSRRSLACRFEYWQQTASARLLAMPVATRYLPPMLRLSEEDAAMLAAMTTGDRTFLNHSLRVGFERTGSFHMLVVSGLHIAILAGCIFGITRSLRLPRLPGTLITLAASFAFALFTGFATPVQRSLWMVALYLLGRLV